MKVWAIVASNTWRLAWRDRLTRVEIVMLALLTCFAAIAAIGSPTPGDCAIQMYATAYAAIPFALILVIGQIGKNPEENIAWEARPVSRGQVMVGRFLGYLALGSTFVGMMGLWGWILMTLMAHLGALSGAWWTVQFSLLTLPSLITVTGAAMWLQARIQGGARYFAPAVSLALLLVFLEDKLPLLTAAVPHLPIFNPFPGFLELGLALPPRLLAPPLISGWLWLNRLVWGLVGLLLLLLAIRRPSRHYPLRHPRFVKNLALTAAILAMLSATGLWVLARTLSPAMDPNVSLATNFTCHTPQIHLTVNAQSGRVMEQTACTASHGGVLRFSLNSGLSIRSPQASVKVVARSRGLAPHSWDREWTLHVSAAGQPRIRLSITGKILPTPRTLPYPPLLSTRQHTGLYAAWGRIYVTHIGQDLPSFLSGSARISLTVTHPSSFPTVTNAAFNGHTHRFDGVVRSLAISEGPLEKRRRGSSTIWLSSPHTLGIGAFLPYIGALRNLKGWITLPREINLAPSPLIATPLWRAPDLFYSDIHSGSGPNDPITGSSSPPTSYTATLTLARIFWQTASATPQTIPDAILTGLCIFKRSDRANLTFLLDQIREGHVSQVGPLTQRQRHQLLTRWYRLRGWPVHRQKLWIRAQYQEVRQS